MKILRDISINKYGLYYVGLRSKIISFECLHNIAGSYEYIETAMSMIPLRALPRLLYDTIGD